MSNGKTESYYKILGTTAKIGNGRIKEKYIQAVKQHPPETDPEGFEKVRRAYETLKDPVKRKQYDLTRKYGDNVEELIEKAFIAFGSEDYQEAAEILEKASKISPDNQSVIIALMMLAIFNGDINEMDILFKKVLEMLSDPEDIAYLYVVKARALFENDYEDLALETLELGSVKCPTELSLFTIPLATIYMHLERFDEAWETINSAIPTPENETIEDIHLFIEWANIMLDSDKRGTLSKVQSRFRKFLKNITDEYEIDMVYDELFDQFEDLYENAAFRSAEFYGDLLKIVADETDTEVKEMMNDTKKLARIQKEIERLERDDEAFPLIFIHVFEWFYEDYIPANQLSMMRDSIPQNFINELKEEKESYAAGIIRLRKKYPLLYKQYKAKWDDLFTELTEGFNREMRRELRKVR